MVSDYTSNYSHGPEIEYEGRKRRKSARKKRKMIIIGIIALILIIAVAIFAVVMFTPDEPEQEDLTWFYEQQQQQQQQQQLEQQKIADTQSHVSDLSNPSAEITPVNQVIDGSTVKLLYNNNIKFLYNPSFEDPYYLKLSNSDPITKIVIEYSVPDVTVTRPVFDGYITKKADDGVLVTIGEKYKTITSTYPDPDAHLGITVTDENGDIVFTDGYNYMGSESSKKQSWSLFIGGNYNIELKGSEISLNVKIYEE